MIRRLFGLIILVLILAGLYYWKVGSFSWQPDSLLRLGKDIRVPNLGGVGTAIRDATLSGTVRAALSLNKHLQPFGLDTESKDGVVTLKGTVQTADQKAMAEQIASGVPNVNRVVNEVRVDPAAKAAAESDRTIGENLDDHTIEMQVKLALSLKKELAGSQVSVTVYKKGVTLSGTATPAQRALAVETARETSGVLSVTDGFSSGGTDLEKGRQAVEHALASNANLAPYRIQVVARADRLVLLGHVRTSVERDLAGLVAERAAAGTVENSLELKP